MTQPFDEQAALLAFLAQRDHPCPGCGYNLRGLARPVCPECGERLNLTVGMRHRPVHWLLLTIIPLAFSSILALVVLSLMLNAIWRHDISFRGETALKLWLSAGLFCAAMSVVLFVLRNRFLRRPLAVQRAAAAAVWLVHLVAMGYLLAQFD